MDAGIVVLALGLLMTAAYRGASVILFAPLAAMAAVLLTDPALLLPLYSSVFMERMAGFVKLYFPVFLLGAVFGKLMEISGFARSIIQSGVRFIGPAHGISAVVFVCALLTYGGVSLFVVAFAVYPFAAELFRASNIPKRLLPASIALGAFTFTMDALPGTPQIQNIIPAGFFGTSAWAAPWLGLQGTAILLAGGFAYLEWRRRAAARVGEGYGAHQEAELAPAQAGAGRHTPVILAIAPLALVGTINFLLSGWLPSHYGKFFDLSAAGVAGFAPIEVSKVAGIWAVEAALAAAIAFVLLHLYTRPRAPSLAAPLQLAVGGAMLAALNTASEYGFGAVIAALPGFRDISGWLSGSIQDPLVNLAVTSNVLAGVTGSASGGMSIVLTSMAATYVRQAAAAGIPNEVLHRVAAMASGGMDTLPHNGAIITLLAITGLTHRESYKDIFVLTVIKTAAAFAIIPSFYWFGKV